LKQRSCLALCLALIDISVPPQDSDKQLLEFLNSSGRPFVIVATKSDRLSGNQLRNALHLSAQTLPGTMTVPFSAKTGAGKEQIWQQIKMAIGEVPPK
jgi:GTP-binding protein